jgi:hypothetical protein
VLQKSNVVANFKAEDINNTRLYFETEGSDWYISDVSLRASQETSFSPDEITFIQPIPRTLPRETFDFRFQFYDINNNYIPVLVEETKTFDGGNLNVINKDLQLVPSSLYFQFDSGSGNGNPLPPTTVYIDVIKNYLTGSVNFTSRSFDFANNELFNTDYVGVGSQYPGLLLDRNLDTVRLTVENFTGSRADKLVQYIEFTGECEGVTDSIIITRVLDGKGGVNHFIRPYRGTQIRNSSTASLEIQAVRIDGINEINLYSGAQDGWGNIQLHVLSASLNPATEPEKFIPLSLASSSKYIRGIITGSLGSKEINYNAVFDRDSIDFRRIIYLMPSSSAAASPAYAVSGSVLASIILEDLQDGLDTPSIVFNADTFAINPRNEINFRPSFAFATASFFERGTTNAITASFRVFPSMSINKDYVPEYWFYYTTQSADKTISVIARDENKNVIDSLPLNSYIGQSNKQSKNLTITFTYTEPWTSASISLDKTFTIIPEGKPGDETIIFEVTPALVSLNATAEGFVNSYSSSVTQIRLKQGSRYLNFTASKGEGTFFIVSGSITGSNIIPGKIINPIPPGFNANYTGSLFIGAASGMNNLSGSVTYNLEIQPFYTSSIYTGSVVQQFTKILDGTPQLEVSLTPESVVLNADENGVVSNYASSNTTLRIKEGNKYLLYNSWSYQPGTFYVDNFEQTNVFTASLTASFNGDRALIRFHNFNQGPRTGSVTYNIIAYPYSLGPGHQYTSSVINKVQNFTKLLDGADSRGVTLSATSNFVSFDSDGVVVSPAGDIELTATVTNFTGSAYYQFLKDNVAYTPIQASNIATIASGDSVAPGETALWVVQVRDGNISSTQPITAQASLTLTGLQQGVPSYNATLTNDNVSIIYRVSGEVELGGTGTTINATKGITQLTHANPFGPQTLDIFSNEIGSLGEYQVTIHSKSAYLGLAGGLVSQSVLPIVAGRAVIGDLVSWTTADSNPIGSVVYRIDFENGKGVAFKTQSFSVQFEGETGPGIVMRGQYSEYEDYIGSYETVNYRRDAIIWPDPSGSNNTTHYFAALSGSGPTTYVNPTTSDYYVGATPPGGYVLIGHQYPPAVGNSNDYWQYLGEQDFFVAAKIAIFEESYVKNSINVGTYNNTSKFANIVIAGGRPDPYISIGQHGTVGTAGTSGTTYNPSTSGASGTSGTGIIGFNRPGIFLGMYEDGVNGTTGRFSIKEYGGSGKGLFWDGGTLTIVGSIKQSSPGVNEGRLMGAWADATVYYTNDIVTYGGNTWTANSNHTSTNNTNVGTGYPGSGPWTIAPIAAKLLRLEASAQVFVETKSGSLSPNYIELTSNKQNISATTNWTTTPSVTLFDSATGGSTTTSGNIVYLRTGSFGTNTLVEISATADSITDTVSIARVKEGSDALTVIVTNESHTLPAANDGTVSSYAGSGTDIYIYEGATQLDYDGVGTSPGKWAVSSSVTNITAGSVTDGGNYAVVGNHSNMTADLASINYTLSGKKINGDLFSLSRVQSFSKSKQGAAGAAGDTGPGVVYRGEYNAATAYIFSAGVRRDIVKYNNAYYLTKQNTTGNLPTNTTYWESFGAQFSSVATDILLAQDATITRALVMGVETSGTGSGIIRSATAATFNSGSGFYMDSSGRVRFGNPIGSQIKFEENNFSITGSISATDGRIGNWIIESQALGGNLRDSGSKLILNPTVPELGFYLAGEKKLNISPVNYLTNVGGSNVSVSDIPNGNGSPYPDWTTPADVSAFGTFATQYGPYSYADVSNFETATNYSIPAAGTYALTNLYTFSVLQIDNLSSQTIYANANNPNNPGTYPGESQNGYASPKFVGADVYLEGVNQSTGQIARVWIQNVSSYSATSVDNWEWNGSSWIYSNYTTPGVHTGYTTGGFTAITDRFITFPSAGNYKFRYSIQISARAGSSVSVDSFGTELPEVFYGHTSGINTAVTDNGIGYNSNSFTIIIPTNIVEVTTGGIQIANDTSTFVQIPRLSTSVGSSDIIFEAKGAQSKFWAFGAAGGAFSNYAIDSRGSLYLAGNIFISGNDASPGYGRLDLAYRPKYGSIYQAHFIDDVHPADTRWGTAGGPHNGTQDMGSNSGTGVFWDEIYADNFNNLSDLKLKENIYTSDLGLDFIKQLRPVKYNFISSTKKRPRYGFIAQEVLTALESLGKTSDDFKGLNTGSSFIKSLEREYKRPIEEIIASGSITGSDGTLYNQQWYDEEQQNAGWSVTYNEFISPMVKAIQELSQKVSSLEAFISGSL